MQNPVGATFNYHTLRMDLHSWSQLWLNPDAQVRFVHTIAAGFGLAATLSVIYLGDANGVEVATAQKAKLAAIEAEWTTAPAPAPWALVAWPNQKEQKNDFAVKLPWAMGVLITHSFDEKIEGLKPIIAENKGKIKRGMIAYGALQKLRDGDTSPTVLNTFKEYQDDLGYGLLLKRYTSTVTNATEAQITKAANGSIPNVPILFWSFRIMVASGFMILWIFILANVFWLRDTAWNKRWFLRLVLYSMPLPWIAAEMGWVVAEVGRQPWVVNGILPTFISILV
jgi:cytochrome d ubiquinol oxidase subunit I